MVVIRPAIIAKLNRVITSHIWNICANSSTQYINISIHLCTALSADAPADKFKAHLHTCFMSQAISKMYRVHYLQVNM